FDDGFASRPANFDGGPYGRIGDAADAVALGEREVCARSSIACSQRCECNARISAGRIYGNGHGRTGAKTGDARSAKKLERRNDGHDDDGARTAWRKVRRDHTKERQTSRGGKRAPP